MADVDLVLIHGFWSGPATWDALSARISSDDELSGVRIHRFGYESPKLRLPFSTTRIPDHTDIAQSFESYLSAETTRSATAIVTHSQGGLILQRFLAWMLNEGRGRELTHIKKIVLLACPNTGSEYLRSIRAMAGFGRHPQARTLTTLNAEVSDVHRTVLNQVVHASGVSERTCPIPIHVYAGRTDGVVGRASSQDAFSDASTLPGNHFTIHDPDKPGDEPLPTLKRHLVELLARRTDAPATGAQVPSTGDRPPGQVNVVRDHATAYIVQGGHQTVYHDGRVDRRE